MSSTALQQVSDTLSKELSQVDEAQKAKIDAIRQSFKLIEAEPAQLITYGASAQQGMSDLAETMLQNVRVKDAGYAGEAVQEMMDQIMSVDVDHTSLEKKLFGLINPFRKFIRRYQSVQSQVDAVAKKLDNNKLDLLKRATWLEEQFKENTSLFEEITNYVLAGDAEIQHVREEQLPVLKQQAEASAEDLLTAQKVSDLNNKLERFERKVHELKKIRMSAVQRFARIRIMQDAAYSEIENIDTIVNHALPEWKDQLSTAIDLYHMKKASDTSKAVTDSVNKLMQQGAQQLEKTVGQIKEQQQRGVIDMESLKQVNQSLVNTLKNTLAIQEKGRQARAEAESELEGLAGELRDALRDAEQRA